MGLLSLLLAFVFFAGVAMTINEAARYLDQTGIDPAELDLTLSLGGWAPHRGGPWAYARELGREKVLEALEFLSQQHGERYRAHDALQAWW